MRTGRSWNYLLEEQNGFVSLQVFDILPTPIYFPEGEALFDYVYVGTYYPLLAA